MSILFIYSLINIYLTLTVQKTSIRLERERDSHNILHKKVIEALRDYQAEKTKNNDIPVKRIEEFIQSLLSEFNDGYLCNIFRSKVTATIKYFYRDQLHSLRAGDRQRRDLGIL
jgi:hypothetical protein